MAIAVLEPVTLPVTEPPLPIDIVPLAPRSKPVNWVAATSEVATPSVLVAVARSVIAAEPVIVPASPTITESRFRPSTVRLEAVALESFDTEVAAAVTAAVTVPVTVPAPPTLMPAVALPASLMPISSLALATAVEVPPFTFTAVELTVAVVPPATVPALPRVIAAPAARSIARTVSAVPVASA